MAIYDKKIGRNLNLAAIQNARDLAASIRAGQDQEGPPMGWAQGLVSGLGAGIASYKEGMANRAQGQLDQADLAEKERMDALRKGALAQAVRGDAQLEKLVESGIIGPDEATKILTARAMPGNKSPFQSVGTATGFMNYNPNSGQYEQALVNGKPIMPLGADMGLLQNAENIKQGTRVLQTTDAEGRPYFGQARNLADGFGPQGGAGQGGAGQGVAQGGAGQGGVGAFGLPVPQPVPGGPTDGPTDWNARQQQIHETLPAIEQVESGGNPNAVSSKGAQGAFQIMPPTAANPGYGMPPIDVKNSTHEEQKAWVENYILAIWKAHPGWTYEQAVQAYHDGAGNVEKGVMGPEGRGYGPAIRAAGAAGAAAGRGMSQSPAEREAAIGQVKTEQNVAEKKQMLELEQQAKIGGELKQKQGYAREQLRLIDQAVPLIAKATGSGIGAKFDDFMGMIGQDTEGSTSSAALGNIAAQFLQFAYRNPGAVSDKDLDMMKQQVGDLGNPNVTVKRKMAIVAGMKHNLQSILGNSPQESSGKSSGKSSEQGQGAAKGAAKRSAAQNADDDALLSLYPPSGG